MFKIKLKGDDCVVACKYITNGNSIVQHYFNVDKEPEILESSYPTVGISEALVSLKDGYLTCSFKREKKNSISSRYFDLNNPYFLMIAKGNLDSNSKKNICINKIITFFSL